MKLRIGILCLLFSSAAMGQAYIGTTQTKIISVDSYNQYGDGDVLLRVENPVPECSDGYWLTKSDPGFQANLSLILSGYQAKNPTIVYGLPGQLWTGSSGKYCKLYSLVLR